MKKTTDAIRKKDTPIKKREATGKYISNTNPVARKYIDNTIKKNADVWRELAKH